VLGGLATLIVAGGAIKEGYDARYFDGYDPTLPLNAVVRGEEDREGYHRVDCVFQGTEQTRVPTLLALPENGEAPFPCVIFLHGIGQSKGFLDEIAAYFTRAGFALASFDQYTRGERKLVDAGLVEKALSIRRRAALNVIETRRLVDYLQTREDIAHDRIYLVGASFGAITGSNATAFEPRIRAAVLTYGGGNLDLLLSSEPARRELGVLHWPVKQILLYITAPAEPLLHVAQIAPRPVLFQNGSHDQIIPVEAAKALVDAAGEPKTFVLYDSDHVGLDEEQTRQVLTEAVEWLKGQDQRLTLASVSIPAPR
jgi:dienelactone hydrolase